LPTFKSEVEAKNFIAKADLSEYDLAGGKPMQYEFQKKTTQVSMRMSAVSSPHS